MSFGSEAGDIAGQPTGLPSIRPIGKPTIGAVVSKQDRGADAPLDVMLERAEAEVLDLVRGRSRRLGQRAVEAAAEHATQQREAAGRDRTATAPRAGAAHRAALVEIERDERVLAGRV